MGQKRPWEGDWGGCSRRSRTSFSATTRSCRVNRAYYNTSLSSTSMNRQKMKLSENRSIYLIGKARKWCHSTLHRSDGSNGPH